MDTGRNDGNWADNSAAVRAVLAGSNPAEVTSTARRLHATIKSHRSFGQPNGDQETGTSAAEKQPQSAYGMKIAQAALQSVGMSIQDCPGPNMGPPEYALAISIIFTKATEQAIMPGTAPRHVLSTSLLCNSLLHDKRFRLVPMSEASPGDIIIESGGNQAHGYAGIVVNHGRLVSNSSQGVQNDSSLVEIQHSHPETVIFRYMGVQGHRISPFANANFNPNEPRILVGQRGGGQWTAGGAGGAQNGRGQLEIAPSTTVLSGGNRWTGSGTGTNALQVDHDNNPKTTGQGEKPNSPLTQVLQALEAGGQHPTPAQLETIGEACDAWQRYVVSHGVSPFVAGEHIQNIIHNFYNPVSGPNPGSEGVLGFQQGQLAGAGAGGIIAGAIVGVSTSQKNSVWSMGPGPRGLEIDKRLGGNLPPGFPTVDRSENGVVTSIKSIDLNATSYQNMRKLATTLENYTDKVATFNGASRGIQKIDGSEITARQLQIAIPPGSMSAAQKAVFEAAATEAQIKGVTIIVTEIH